MPAPLTLSVIIPTLGRPTLSRTIRSLLALNEAVPLEIIVVGRVHTPSVAADLEALCAANNHLRHLAVEFPTGDSSRKKNAGAAAAHGALLGFLDDDVVAPPDWAARITAPFTDPSVGLVSGPSLIPDDLNRFGRWAGLALASRAAGYVMHRYRAGDRAAFAISWSRVIGCNAVYRRDAFEQLGGFDPGFYPGEELLAAYRTQQNGQGLRFVPGAAVWHYPRQSPGRFWRQIWGYGATRIRLFRAGAPWELTTLLPGLAVAGLVLLLPLALTAPWARWTLALAFGAYILGALLAAAEMAWKTRRPDDLLLAALIPFMHLSYGLAQWHELLRPNQDLGVRLPR
ncbi:MAG: glycosyltransferase [Candidatus Marinimicrobia bacterium]|nr:glycosyltransferase [Candidatus Neomarinimicrobiota bacterium]